MGKKIIEIDQDKCIGCGLCAKACQQSAIELVDGKATVVRQDFCDGLGNCLPVCPVDAIHFSNKDVVAKPKPSGCPGMRAKAMTPKPVTHDCPSALMQWPVQIKLLSPYAPYFEGCDLLIAADCTAYAYGNFHSQFMENKITIIGCPKLDDMDYTDKLTAIFKENNIRSVTLTRMEVPCCGGLQRATVQAIANSGKDIPCQIITISTNGTLL
ncbi:MAG: 4Fe-4S binding protein [Eubacteriales bacterium]